VKTRALLITIVLLTVVTAVVAGGSQKKLSTEEAYEILAGTWMNEEYSEIEKHYKYVIQEDGTYTVFTTVSSGETITGKSTITDIVIVSDGTIWIKSILNAIANQVKFTHYEIWKLSDSNMTVELFYSEVEGWYGKGFPIDLETGDHARYNYLILYRQE